MRLRGEEEKKKKKRKLSEHSKQRNQVYEVLGSTQESLPEENGKASVSCTGVRQICCRYCGNSAKNNAARTLHL